MSPWADMKIKTKNAKNGVTSTVNLALHKDLILKTPKREVRLDWWKWKKLHMERHYEGNHILFLESTAQSMSIQICICFFINICDLVRSRIYMRRVTVDT